MRLKQKKLKWVGAILPILILVEACNCGDQSKEEEFIAGEYAPHEVHDKLISFKQELVNDMTEYF